MTATTGKPSTCLKLTHQEVRRLLDALQGTDEPLRLCTWEDSDRRGHCKLIHRLQRADRRFYYYE